MKTLTALLVGLTFSLSSLSAEEEPFRTFTDTEGRTLEAKLLDVDGGTLTLIIKGGKTYKLPVTKFSPEDQNYAKKFLENKAKNYAPKLEVRYQSRKGDRADAAGDFDDRVQFLEPVVKITNRDLTFTLENAKSTVVAFGRHVTDRSAYKVLLKENFKYTIAPGKTAELYPKKVRIEYDDANSARSGHKYAGYAVVTQNASGKIIDVSGSVSFIKFPEKVLKVGKGADITRDLAPLGYNPY